MVKKSLCGLTADEIYSLIAPYGFSNAHALAISNSIYKKGITDISLIPKIPGKLKVVLATITSMGTYSPVFQEVSKDKTIKYLFKTETGKEFETVYIPDNKRNTVCVSTQSGCRMGCPFCATGRYGFRGNLSVTDIVNQLISITDARKITHIVFMGMGEPMDNLDNVLEACRIITSEWGLAISPRNVTVSTVGITPVIEKFLQSTDCNLTVSLHSPFSEERKLIVPVETIYPVNKILEILMDFPARKKRRLSLAYMMIENMNDTDRHLKALKDLLRGTKIRVNLLPYHNIIDESYKSSSLERMQYFKHNLIVSGISASVRKSRGIDISAACGLLAEGLK